MVITTLQLRLLSAELAEAAANLKTFSGLVPICSYCKEIRNDDGYWERVKSYIQSRTGANSSRQSAPRVFTSISTGKTPLRIKSSIPHVNETERTEEFRFKTGFPLKSPSVAHKRKELRKS